jgi:hypothetical protein
MELIQEKSKMEYDEIQKKLIKIFQFNKENIILQGSSIVKNIRYFSDYDFITNIKRNYGINEIYDEFHKILKTIFDDTSLYFIEFKLQTNDNKKIRWFYDDNFNKNDFIQKFNNVAFCKIDIIVFYDNIFREASCIYNFNSKSDYVNNILKDIKEFKKDKNYFKVLKRIYLIEKLKNDKNNISLLNDVFNSELGLLYKNISNIDTIETIKKYYTDSLTKKRIDVNLSEIKYPINFKEKYNVDKNKLNKNSKELLKYFKY